MAFLCETIAFNASIKKKTWGISNVTKVLCDKIQASETNTSKHNEIMELEENIFLEKIYNCQKKPKIKGSIAQCAVSREYPNTFHANDIYIPISVGCPVAISSGRYNDE
jgi:hypothetical protein